jgi:ATP-dependent exoDNAse (exonuclease V) alpha subunit
VWVAASVLAVEGSVAEVAGRIAATTGRAVVPVDVVERTVAEVARALGRPLTVGQRRAVTAITTSGAGLDLVVGVAGAGKTTALEVARTAFERSGYRVLGAATSGQAARALSDQAGVETRTIASVVWRLAHGTLRLDDRTVVFVDEVGMTSDRDLLALLVAAEAAGTKLVTIGDHHQLSAVAPGGGLEALVARHPHRVHVLEQNIRQHDPEERVVLSMVRDGSIDAAVDWYQHHDRIHIQSTRDDTIRAAVTAWAADRAGGLDSVLLAWRRRDVAALNALARHHLQSTGELSEQELMAPGGRRYAVGDRIVTLSASGDDRWVTSQRGTITRVEEDSIAVRFDDGTTYSLAGGELCEDRLDHAYAVTVHRTQGATVDTAHLYADGGGRELAYVALSRARLQTTIHAAADTPDQAAEDLKRDWSAERRQRWTIDTDTLLGAHEHSRPDLARRIDSLTHRARIRAEREAAAATGALDDTTRARLELRERLAGMDAPTQGVPQRGLGLQR